MKKFTCAFCGENVPIQTSGKITCPLCSFESNKEDFYDLLEQDEILPVLRTACTELFHHESRINHEELYSSVKELIHANKVMSEYIKEQTM